MYVEKGVECSGAHSEGTAEHLLPGACTLLQAGLWDILREALPRCTCTCCDSINYLKDTEVNTYDEENYGKLAIEYPLYQTV